MKFLVVLSLAVACVVADVSHLAKDDYNTPIVKSNYEITPEGAFQYEYQTANGIIAQAQGVIKNPNNEYPYLEIQGGYRYTAPDGTPVEVTYVADEGGYKPAGNVIPTDFPIPEYIARSLAYIQAHPPQEGGIKPSKPAYSPLG